MLELIIQFFTLSALEIVLGIDNIIFIAILVERLDKSKREKARLFGLSLAMITRVLLLFSLTWISRLTTPIIYHFSGRDLLLIGGGLFLIWKPISEIIEKFKDAKLEAEHKPHSNVTSFWSVIVQIIFIDIVLSLDSVITAIGISNQLPIMASAIIAAVLVMMIFAKSVGDFINNNPRLKMLALAFLIVVGFFLLLEPFGVHIDKGYLYFATFFSIAVELLNMKLRKVEGFKE